MGGKTFSGVLRVRTGAPQCGQALARLDTVLPQSVQGISSVSVGVVTSGDDVVPFELEVSAGSIDELSLQPLLRLHSVNVSTIKVVFLITPLSSIAAHF